jgi:hypothetical protein
LEEKGFGFSDQALDEFNDVLAKQHPKWFKTFQKNLQTWLKNSSPNEWSKLEAQDRSGRLKKLNFEKAIKRLFTHN